MRLQNHLILFATLSHRAYATCFWSGINWDNAQDSARGAVEYWCRDASDSARLTGVFHSGDSKGRCSNLLLEGQTIGKRLDITVQWLGQDESVLEVDQCIQRLNDEIGCDLGGSKVTNEWSFTSDPNTGLCAKVG
ncbi:hypothetical protein GQ607_013006 [Colletotrichum asianum]|uniref:Ecp2 effector protein domain-containing protein n=1 Tax=Colletotrichum asianum TaxID=702518 RepID=A0A8H3W4J5_9PEZI|nr:hypothetical protein GQ607_013006 [Colletotrichum asianum]